MLARARAIGKWKYVDQRNGDSVRPPSITGSFYGTNINGVGLGLTNWADLRLIMLNDTDLDGTTYTFQDFSAGDKFEILSTDGVDACFGSISTPPNPDLTYGNVVVSVERSNGGPREDQEYVISVFPPGSGGEIDLDVLDERYVSKFGDTMVGNLSIPDPLSTEPSHAANKKYVDEAVGATTSALSDYLPLSGGTQTGIVTGKPNLLT